MRNLAFRSALALSCILVAQAAQAQFQNRVPGSQQADVHNPFSPSYLPLLPNQPIRSGGAVRFRPQPGAVTYSFYHGGLPYFYGGYYDYVPLYGYPYYDPYYYGYSGYALPPVISSEPLFGPAAVNRFLGWDQPARVTRAHRQSSDEGSRPKVRETSGETKLVAGKAIDFGDLQFAKSKYQSALERYRKAAQTAPDMAESYYRQGHALIALGQYPAAGKAFRKGLEIGADWLESGFRLDRLYGQDRATKIAHLESLAEALEKSPQDANLLFILGMQLFFDGQVDRSRKFFERSAQFGGNRDGLLDPVLLEVAPDAKQKPQAGHVEF